jgi:hypothetical protein
VSLAETFDRIVSSCAFRKLNDHDLEREAWRMNDHTTAWLLVNKISSKGNISYDDLETTVRHAAQSMVYCKSSNSEANVCEEEY